MIASSKSLRLPICDQKTHLHKPDRTRYCISENFPFDEQWCNIGFASTLAHIGQMQIVTEAQQMFIVVSSLYVTWSLSRFQGIPEWELHYGLAFQSSYNQTGRNYSLATITLHLNRNPQFYIYCLILPTFVITATCISAMLLPVNMGLADRVSTLRDVFCSRLCANFSRKHSDLSICADFEA